MGWRGLVRPCRTRLTGCPACQLRRPTAGARHPRVVAVSRPLPRLRSFLLRWCPFPAVKVFLLLCESRRKPSRIVMGNIFTIHRTAAVIRSCPRLSTDFFTAYPQPRVRPVRGVPVSYGRTRTSAFADFGRRAGVSVVGGGIWLGHNRSREQCTRPPPYMGWRGPCSTLPYQAGRLPGLPGSDGRPPGPDIRR